MKFRQRANFILAITVLFLILISYLRVKFQGNIALEALQFALEAALIGGVADWFAINALFRKPFGWPFHTELIPKNREKIIDTLSGLIQSELLSATSLKRTIKQTDFVQPIITNLENNKSIYIELLTIKIRKYIVTNRKDLKYNLGLYIKKNLTTLSPVIAEFLYEKAENPHFLLSNLQNLLQMLSHEIHNLIYTLLTNMKENKTQESSFKKLFTKALENSYIIDLNDATGSIHSRLMIELSNITTPSSPISKLLIHIYKELLKEQQLKEILEKCVTKLINDPLSEENINIAVENLINNLTKEKLLVEHFTYDIFNNSLRIIREKKNLQILLNALIQDTLNYFVELRHPLIGEIVKEILKSFNNKKLNDFIETRAGNELQWLRINGSVIGATIGLITFCFLKFIYEPLIILFQ